MVTGGFPYYLSCTPRYGLHAVLDSIPIHLDGASSELTRLKFGPSQGSQWATSLDTHRVPSCREIVGGIPSSVAPECLGDSKSRAWSPICYTCKCMSSYGIYM